MEMLSDVDDPRQPSNGTRHDFLELLVMTISAVLSDCDTIEDVAAWSRAHTHWLRQFLVLKNGVPSEDTFLRVFRLLDPKQFERCFRQWVSRLIPNLSRTIAVDGKTVRGSGSGGETAIHMVSAFETRLGLVLGQEKVSAKRNEITAIPELQNTVGNSQPAAKNIAMLLVGFRYTNECLASFRSSSNCCSLSGEAMNPNRV